MTYSRLLLQFIAVPIIALGLLILRDRHRMRERAREWRGWSPLGLLAALMVVATLYTIPWDDHLIATHVWWYEPALISGVTLGHIPLEEALFFPSQTLLVGLWFLWLAPYVARRGVASQTNSASKHASGCAHRARLSAAITISCLWLLAVVTLLVGWRPGTYASWELAWALPPVILQVYLGGDILWSNGRLLASAVIPAVLYLCAVDAFAIHQGIWTIDPRQSFALLLGGLLPLEEVVFFSVTTVLVAFGLTLGVAVESRIRISALQTRIAVSLGRR